ARLPPRFHTSPNSWTRARLRSSSRSLAAYAPTGNGPAAGPPGMPAGRGAGSLANALGGRRPRDQPDRGRPVAAGDRDQGRGPGGLVLGQAIGQPVGRG